MTNYTSSTYRLKRKILNFTNKISIRLFKPERKFTADITYGMLASGSCLLTDVVKPAGCKFESLGIVRDGSDSTSAKSVYKKGYHVTEACVLTLLPVIILSVFFQKYTLHPKRITNLPTPLLSMPWNKAQPSLEKRLSS